MATDTDTTTDDDELKSRQQRRSSIRRLKKMRKRCQRADKRYRKRSERGVKFVFNDQWDDADKAILEERGQFPVVINRCKPTVRLVHSFVVSSPTKWHAKPVGAKDDGVAEAATAGLDFVARVNGYKSLREKVYWWALTYGVGWAMIGANVRDDDPTKEIVQVRLLQPGEVSPDPQCKEDDFSDARYAIWSRKVDLSDAIATYREHAEALKSAAGSDRDDQDSDEENYSGVVDEDQPPVSQWEALDDENGYDDSGDVVKQVTLHELWEKTKVPGWLMEHTNGWIHEFDPNDPEAVAMLSGPDVKRYWEGDVTKVRYYIWAGDTILDEGDSPYTHNRLPFVPCWFERDQHGDPISLVDAIIDVQREINYRRAAMLYEMGTPSVRVSPGVLERMNMSQDQAVTHARKPGALWIANAGEIEIMVRGDISAQQFSLMQDSKGEIQAISGANDDLMGYDSSSKSGKAKEIQMTQGSMMMRPSEANLRLFDRLVAEQVLALIQQYHTDEWVVRITDEAMGDKFVTLNQAEFDPMTGQFRVLNDLNQYRYDIEIDEMPWTPTQREQATAMLNDMANNEPDPMLRLAYRRLAVESSDWPDKAKLLDILGTLVDQMMAPPPMVPPGVGADPMADPMAQQQMMQEGMVM